MVYSRQREGANAVTPPPNYSGNAFRARRASVVLPPEKQNATHKYSSERRADKNDEPLLGFPIPHAHEPPISDKPISEPCDTTVQPLPPSEPTPPPVNLPNSLLSPLGSLGTEEMLLICLALIVFQSGDAPDLALILLALLFV